MSIQATSKFESVWLDDSQNNSISTKIVMNVLQNDKFQSKFSKLIHQFDSSLNSDNLNSKSQKKIISNPLSFTHVSHLGNDSNFGLEKTFNNLPNNLPNNSLLNSYIPIRKNDDFQLINETEEIKDIENIENIEKIEESVFKFDNNNKVKAISTYRTTPTPINSFFKNSSFISNNSHNIHNNYLEDEIENSNIKQQKLMRSNSIVSKNITNNNNNIMHNNNHNHNHNHSNNSISSMPLTRYSSLIGFNNNNSNNNSNNNNTNNSQNYIHNSTSNLIIPTSIQPIRKNNFNSFSNIQFINSSNSPLYYQNLNSVQFSISNNNNSNNNTINNNNNGRSSVIYPLTPQTLGPSPSINKNNQTNSGYINYTQNNLNDYYYDIKSKTYVLKSKEEGKKGILNGTLIKANNNSKNDNDDSSHSTNNSKKKKRSNGNGNDEESEGVEDDQEEEDDDDEDEDEDIDNSDSNSGISETETFSNSSTTTTTKTNKLSRKNKRKAKRSRGGCLTCRQRKKRCCETKPNCSECIRLNISCRWPFPGCERKNKSKTKPRLSHDEIYHEVYGIIKVLRGVVDYKIEE